MLTISEFSLLLFCIRASNSRIYFEMRKLRYFYLFAGFKGVVFVLGLGKKELVFVSKRLVEPLLLRQPRVPVLQPEDLLREIVLVSQNLVLVLLVNLQRVFQAVQLACERVPLEAELVLLLPIQN